MAEFKEVSPNAGYGEKLMTWVDNRFPASKLYKEHMSEYYAPKNFNFWYVFGSLALLVLVIQIVTGIFLVMHYKPDAASAFASVEYIMRDVPWGWLIRYMHSTGASAFFVVVYLHMFRGLLYGSYRKPRELVWIFGCAIFLCLMAEAFMGYLLPWGQMSYWGAQVIVNLFAAIPFIGPDLALLIRGDYVVSDATLNRFFSFHVIAVPLVLLGLVAAHIIALHEVGSNNPDGVEIKGPNAPKDAAGHPLDGVPFHPYYTVHDIFAVVGLPDGVHRHHLLRTGVRRLLPRVQHFIPADSLKTPLHIAPVWYFTPFYSMLRAITTEMMYVLSVIVLAVAAFVFLKTKLPQLVKLVVAAAAVVMVVLFGGLSFTGVQALSGIDASSTAWSSWAARSSSCSSCRGSTTARSSRSATAPTGTSTSTPSSWWCSWCWLTSARSRPRPWASASRSWARCFYFGFFLLMPWWSKLGTPKQPPERITFTAH